MDDAQYNLGRFHLHEHHQAGYFTGMEPKGEDLSQWQLQGSFYGDAFLQMEKPSVAAWEVVMETENAKKTQRMIKNRESAAYTSQLEREILLLKQQNWKLKKSLLMCHTSDFAVGAVLGQMLDKKPVAVYYARKTLGGAQGQKLSRKKMSLCSAGNISLNGRQLHAHVFSLGFHLHPSLLPRLVALYASLSLLNGAVSIASSSSSPFPWNILLSHLLRSHLPHRALSLLNAVPSVSLDGFSFSSLLKACAQTRNLSLLTGLHAKLHKTGLPSGDIFLQNALLSAYAKCGEVCMAVELFEGMPQRDVVSWNAVISAFLAMGTWEKASSLLERMKTEVAPNGVTWNAVITGNWREGKAEEALSLVSRMRETGTTLDGVTFVVAMAACSELRSLKRGRELHGASLRLLCCRCERVESSLIAMYAKCGRVEMAERQFWSLERRSEAAWSAVIGGEAAWGRRERAIEFFRGGFEREGWPSEAAFLAVLSLGDVRHGRELHCRLIKTWFWGGLKVWNALVSMYCRAGRVGEAWKVFGGMGEKDRATYTAMIGGLGRERDGYMAMVLFRCMVRDDGVGVDHVAVSAALGACCRAGLLAEAQWVFENMGRLYSVVPRREHYSCMATLHARNGWFGRGRLAQAQV
ncbi:pentatricopeptide repeat-containing protein At1g71490-like [Wolffia australiana]